jgi:hypothetical protein
MTCTLCLCQPLAVDPLAVDMQTVNCPLTPSRVPLLNYNHSKNPSFALLPSFLFTPSLAVLSPIVQRLFGHRLQIERSTLGIEGGRSESKALDASLVPTAASNKYGRANRHVEKF